MRTTNKKFKEQVQKHVLNGINEELTFQDVVNNFYKEKYSAPAETRINKYDAFKDWLTGLPSSLDVEYTNHGIHETLKGWFEDAGEEYDERKYLTNGLSESDLYFHLVTREFRSLAKQNGIDF